MSYTKDVKEFHKHFEIKTREKAGFLADNDQLGRLNFLLEELNELAHASGAELILADDGAGKFQYFLSPARIRSRGKILPKALDAIIDILYVAFGTADLMGLSDVLPEAWKRIHSANLKKISAGNEGDGQKYIVSPRGWISADLQDLCQ